MHLFHCWHYVDDGEYIETHGKDVLYRIRHRVYRRECCRCDRGEVREFGHRLFERYDVQTGPTRLAHVKGD